MLPDWVPQPGQVAVLTVANGGLANNYRSQCAPYYSPFFFVKTSNTYGGCFKNPYWGDHGCALFFSGGHANTNDNSVTVAEYGMSAVRFRRVLDPTPWFGTGTDQLTQYNNSVGDANAHLDWVGVPGASDLRYGVSTIDGKIGSSHTYGSGDFIGPLHGGAAHGSFVRVVSPAINQRNTRGAVSAFALDFADTDSPSSARSWRQLSEARRSEVGFGSAPTLTQFVGTQQRVYIVTNGLTAVRWFDLASGEYVTGTGTGFGYDDADGYEGGTMFLVPSRGLLVCAFRYRGQVRLQWMDVTVAQPTLGGTATLSHTLEVPDPWGAATWCSHNERIILGGIAQDNEAVYEVAIPANPRNTWEVSRAPFPEGQTLPAMSSASEFKRFAYDEELRAIFYFEGARREDQGEDVAYVYRPRGT